MTEYAIDGARTAPTHPHGHVLQKEDRVRLSLLRQLISIHIERLIDLLDRIDGDPDFELDHEIGIEDLPHDQVDEGNDEPGLAHTEAGHYGGRLWCALDGEINESEEAA